MVEPICFTHNPPQLLGVGCMRHQDFIDISEAPDAITLERRLLSFAQNKLGFGMLSAALAVEQPGQEPVFVMIGNTPEGFAEASRATPNFQRDPVMNRMKTSTIPFTYDQLTYLNAGAIDLWDTASAFGYRTGIAMALHMPNGKHFLLGVDREEQLPTDDAQVIRLMSHLQLLAVFAQEAADRVLLHRAKRDAGVISLSPREREILQWTRGGKTAWEVAQFLNISERTVTWHIRNAIAKTGAANKHGAAAVAAQLGLL
jgi:DNA-binding CsgD family transcriptional regulator